MVVHLWVFSHIHCVHGQEGEQFGFVCIHPQEFLPVPMKHCVGTNMLSTSSPYCFMLQPSNYCYGVGPTCCPVFQNVGVFEARVLSMEQCVRSALVPRQMVLC